MSVVAPKEVLPPKLAGKAVYLELVVDPELDEDKRYRVSSEHRYNPTKQVIIFPAWEDDSGNIHRAVGMYRTVSEMSPRAQWDITSRITPVVETNDDDTPNYYRDTYLDYQQIKKGNQDLMAKEDLLRATKRHLDYTIKKLILSTDYVEENGETKQIAMQGWIVRENKTVVVEVTTDDLQIVRDSKTPQAVIRRINKVRNSLDNFPEKLA